MDMHRAHRHADWEQVDPKEWNGWQRYANQTKGWLTPGNVVSIIGFFVTIIGFQYAWRGAYIAGLYLVVTGRGADILDGFVANKTGTKSSVGESLDATLDKVALLMAATVFWHVHAVAHRLLLAMLAVHACIGTISLFARLRNIEIHPSRTGKYGTLILWCGLALALLQLAGVHSGAAMNSVLIVALFMALYALYTYVRDIVVRPFDKVAANLERELSE